MNLPPVRLESEHRQRGFTLTEILVVIAIIAVLAALGTAGVMKALETAKQTKIKVEVDNLDLALKQYKEKYGSYPPSDLTHNGPAIIKAHVARAFPRYYDINQAYNDVAKCVDDTQMRMDQMLVFWLNGFNPDVTRPFQGLDTATPLQKSQRTPPLFDFDQSRLKQLNNPPGKFALSYIPPGLRTDVPYLYFDADAYSSSTWSTFPMHFDGRILGLGNDPGEASIYFNDVDGNGLLNPTPAVSPQPAGPDTWCNPESFQLICCGLDGLYGSTRVKNKFVVNTYRLYPIGNLISPPAMAQAGMVGYDINGADDDNITNFCAKARLGDARP